MRTIKLLLLGIMLLAGFASHAAAQTNQNWTDHGYFSVNIAGQAREQEFAETSTFAIYNESGRVGNHTRRLAVVRCSTSAPARASGKMSAWRSATPAIGDNE